jgi:hypothetical protein
VRPLAAALFLAVIGCGCTDSGTASTLLSPTTTTMVVTTTTSTTVAQIAACREPDFLPAVLPAGVSPNTEPSDIPLDQFTAIPGTSTSLWANESGDPVLILIRGALPPQRWVEAPEVIRVRGVDAALGMLPDAHWAVAWFEGPDRCDEYSLIMYPPADAETVRATAESLVEGRRGP